MNSDAAVAYGLVDKKLEKRVSVTPVPTGST
jgi:hypothetical protein